MRRAVIVLIAVMAVLLAYPTTMLSAKTSLVTNGGDTPTIISTPNIPPGPENSGSGDGGDGDGIAGYRGGTPTGGPDAVINSYELMARAWWQYFMLQIRLGL